MLATLEAVSSLRIAATSSLFHHTTKASARRQVWCIETSIHRTDKVPEAQQIITTQTFKNGFAAYFQLGT